MDVAQGTLGAIRAAADKAGQEKERRRVFLLGHKSNCYDMRVIHFALGRATGAAGRWGEQLEEAGVVGIYGSMAMLAAPFNALNAEGFNGKNGNLERIYAKVIGWELEPARLAGGDVKGLVRIARECEAIKRCILTRNVGFALSDWRTHSRLPIERKAFMDRKKSMREAAGANGANPLLSPTPKAPP